MTEPLFITYANNSLKKEPRNFYKIIEKIDDEFWDKGISLKRSKLNKELFSHFPPFPIHAVLRPIVNFILDLNDDYEIAKNVLLDKKYEDEQRYGSEFINHATIAYEVAFEAVFGYEDFYCIAPDPSLLTYHIVKCSDNALGFKRLLFTEPGDSDLFMSKNRINCYECEQLFFIEILKQIIDGVEYDKIPEFLPFLETIIKWSSREVVKDLSSDYRWINPLDEHGIWCNGPNREHPYKHVFNEYLRGFIALSLKDFLVDNDHRKLKCCPFCNKFYIADDLRQKKCKTNKDCKKAYEREKKRIQRENNPIKYQ